MNIKIKMGAKELVELGRRRCPPGKILRSGFTRENGTYVKPDCVKDQGARGKTPAAKRVLPPPKPGTLKGWHADSSAAQRHAALRRAVKSEGCRGVIGRLTLERNYTKTTSPQTSRTAQRDAKWLHDQDFCKFKTKRK